MNFRSFFTLSFVAVLMLICAPAQAGSDVTLINNAALTAGEGLVIEAYQIKADKDHILKNMAVGPVTADCRNGCGKSSGGFDAAPGVYRIDVRNQKALEMSSVTFTLVPGEQYVWMISNRATPPTYTTEVEGIDVTSDEGPFRIDLIGYTKVDMPQTQSSAPVAHKQGKKPSRFWPFKPTNRTRDRDPINN